MKEETNEAKENTEEKTNVLLDKIAKRIKKVGLAALLGEERP